MRIDQVLAHFPGAYGDAGTYAGTCPSCGGRLAILKDKTGGLSFCCDGDCTTGAILDGACLPRAALTPEWPEDAPPKTPIIHEAKALPPPEAPAGPEPLAPDTAGTLLQAEYPPLLSAVDRLICEGLTMLVAASKVGKSWLVLLMAACVAMGKPFLGRQTTRCRVLYLALEDSPRRLRERLLMLRLGAIPDGLELATHAEMIDTGFLEQVDEWLSKAPGPALVIIDTLQKVRGLAKRGINAYEGDYELVGRIKALADRHRAMIVCVHHTNKIRHAVDPFDRVSGSTGIMGAADTTIIIDRERGQDTATVRYEGRDAWGDDFVIRFDDGRWELESESLADWEAGKDYEGDPLVQLLRRLIAENPGGGRWTYNELIALGLEYFECQPFIDGKECAAKLGGGLAKELRTRDRILVEWGTKSQGSRGVKMMQLAPATGSQTLMPPGPTN